MKICVCFVVAPTERNILTKVWMCHIYLFFCTFEKDFTIERLILRAPEVTAVVMVKAELWVGRSGVVLCSKEICHVVIVTVPSQTIVHSLLTGIRGSGFLFLLSYAAVTLDK